MSDATPPAPERTLHTAAGQPVPPRLEADMAQLFRFPPEALDNFWEVLGPFLSEPPPRELAKQLAAFAKRYELDPPVLGDSLRACRVLFREAARWRLSREQLAEDVAVLTGGDERIAAALMAGWEPAMAQLHQEITYRSVLDHGRVLADVTWRFDQMLSSARGETIGEPVASLTLSYLEGGQLRRITLQALPRELAKLHAVCKHLLS